MPERALKCPQCKAPLAASRFSRSTVCPFCGTTVLFDEETIPASRFRAAFAAWNDPAAHGFANWVTLAGPSHWALGELVAHGEASEVYAARRARWPSERALLKVLRDRRDLPAFRHEWEVLSDLARSATGGGFARRLPQPIARGEVTAGAPTGSMAMVLGWADGFLHTFEDVARAYPQGIEPRASIWIWRRILETLAFVHGAGFVHGAVLPQHLLVEEGEHGVRLVGFRAAGKPGEPLGEVSPRHEAFYPRAFLGRRKLSFAADLAMSARAVAVLLGGSPATGDVPDAVPAPLAEELRRAARLDEAAPRAAWTLRERLGALATEVYGPPVFCPLEMP